MKSDVRQLGKQIDHLLDRSVDASDRSKLSADEKRIAALKREKVLAKERRAQSGKPRQDPLGIARPRHAIPCNSSVYKGLFDVGHEEDVLRPVFALAYCRNKGCRKPDLAMPFMA